MLVRRSSPRSRRRRLALSAAVGTSLLIAPAPVAAQTGLPPVGCDPPALLHVVRTAIAPGRDASEVRDALAQRERLQRAAAPFSLDFVTLAGGPESWRLTALGSFSAWQAEIERAPAAADAGRPEAAFERTSYLARYRSELSYRADVDLSGLRYVMVALVQLRPGRAAEFAELRERDSAAHVAAQADENWAVYEVVAGLPGGSFLILTPMKSLAYEDDVPRLFLAKIRASLGDAGRRRLQELNAAAIERTENTFLRLRPATSHPPAAWRERDPGVWGRP